MKILITTLGSRGDVQPFLALAVGLQQAGHQVTLAAPHTFAEWIRAYGVSAHPVRFNPQEFMQQPEVEAILNSRNVLRQLRLMRDEMGAGIGQSLHDFWEAAQTADFLVAGGGGLGGVDIASQRGLPLAFGHLQPVLPTRAFPPFLLPFRFSFGGHYNYLTAALFSRAAWPMLSAPINRWRTTQMGWPPWRSATALDTASRRLGAPWLNAYSPSVLPKPADWASEHHVTGYWFLDAPPAWQPPEDLLRFLDRGAPPVSIGFGSMRADPERLTQLMMRALELSGQRGLLLTGWGGLAPHAPSDKIFFAENVPHAWLFPRLAAVVHHGGAGTTGAGLRAGVPNIITPHSGDQYAWAEQVVKLGAGPRAPEMKKLTAEKLAEAINTAVNDSAMRARAAALGEKIRTENGVARAVEIIERHAAEFKHTE